uniref:Polyhomeotic homolog 1 n=1 Tax=Ornithorhynchus anatinus TaxID=9258 RepID=A0A6I8NER5_ORNAN
METESEPNSSPTPGASGSGGSSRPQIAQMSLYERQAVQALQALQRQPNAAQYFHQFMLQQQLSNAQLHSLAAVQQATIAASRQASSPNPPQQTPTTQASINLATTSAAQLISRSQSVSSPSATTLTQSVLLGNPSSPPLNQTQAQMYLRPGRRKRGTRRAGGRRGERGPGPAGARGPGRKLPAEGHGRGAAAPRGPGGDRQPGQPDGGRERGHQEGGGGGGRAPERRHEPDPHLRPRSRADPHQLR